MHIAFVFPGENLTDKEFQLVQRARQLPGVSMISVAFIRKEKSVVTRVERWRANIERAVARQPLPETSSAILANTATIVNVESLADAVRETASAHRIVNLSGDQWPASSTTAAAVFEVLWDGRRPSGLGQRIARQSAPRDLAVTYTVGAKPAQVVQHSTLTLTPATPAGDRRNASSRTIALLLRALGSTINDFVPAAPPLRADVAGSRASAASRTVDALSAAAGVIGAALYRPASRRLYREDAWEILYRVDPKEFVANSAQITSHGFKTYRPGYDRFVADPIPFAHDGVQAVFFEEYPYATRKGLISCAVLQPNGELGASTPVLERPYHLSYPFVFRDGNHVYMVPETSANRTIDLYECTSFPYVWEFRRTLLSNISANDATLYHDGERWWMFATVSNEGAYAWDELHLFFADQVSGTWHPHAANPVKCDVHSSRPAGPLFMKDNRLLRPTQDCSSTYGGAVNICAVETLSETAFREQVVDRFDPQLFPGMNGLHTLAASPRIEVIDVCPRRRMRWERGTI